jgi:hypothetical protein
MLAATDAHLPENLQRTDAMFRCMDACNKQLLYRTGPSPTSKLQPFIADMLAVVLLTQPLPALQNRRNRSLLTSTQVLVGKGETNCRTQIPRGIMQLRNAEEQQYIRCIYYKDLGVLSAAAPLKIGCLACCSVAAWQ